MFYGVAGVVVGVLFAAFPKYASPILKGRQPRRPSRTSESEEQVARLIGIQISVTSLLVLLNKQKLVTTVSTGACVIALSTISAAVIFGKGELWSLIHAPIFIEALSSVLKRNKA
eukprot:TRINITY_DN31515_c0_g1_i1.p1 TRINITY_DN31515_c0_g1~~TRINITY_DN31515_c0_g1_i1.p1  ORF type:complete len:115 (+),score=11.77 TRINITY_DN31515_c0_g1_i1:48-392(+)